MRVRFVTVTAAVMLIGLGCRTSSVPKAVVTQKPIAASQPTTAPAAQAAAAAEAGPGVLVVTFSCFGQYGVFLMTNEMVSGVPAFPYCWDDTKPWVKGDINFDGVVTQVDLTETIGLCMSGPSIPYPKKRGDYIIRCDLADLDEDGDVDQTDFGLMQVLINGHSWVYSEHNP